MAKLTAFLEPVIKWLALVLFATMVIAALLQVFTRYVINSSLSWTDELARFTFIWSTMLGAALVHKKRGHIMIDLLVSRFNDKYQALWKIIIDIFSLIILLILTVQGLNLLSIGALQTTPALEIKMSYVMLSVPVAGAYMCLVTVEHLVGDFRAFTRSGGETQ